MQCTLCARFERIQTHTYEAELYLSPEATPCMARKSAKKPQKKNALDILSKDIWCHILGLVRYEVPKPRYYYHTPEYEIPGHALFVNILTVSKAWMVRSFTLLPRASLN